MKGKTTYFILPILVIFGLFWPSSSLAQAPRPEIVIIHTAAEAQADNLALNVFFTLTDQNGRPIPRDGVNIEWANVELLEGNKEPVGANIQDPQTPIFIVLLLDASGSMAGVMDDVREAAKSAIDSAPPNAVISVIKFNELALEEELRPIEDFTDNHELVRRAIDAIDNPQGPTCLYNVLYKSIELLEDEVQKPQERQAIILFTDGRDERGDGSIPCSQRTYDDVIVRATRSGAPITPIHTIGLCADEQCSNINASELHNMALETRAFSATGQSGNLSNMFQAIMDGLNSQWVAQANVFARQGENQAVLRVKLRDSDSPLIATFSFLSTTDYVPPPAPVRLQVSGLTYDPQKDTYAVSLSVANPESVLRIIVEVWDTNAGVQILPNQTFENPGSTVQFERDTEGLEAGREYVFRVKAEDKQELLIENEDGEVILAEAEFVYEPPLRPDVEFTIESVIVDSKSGTFTIDLNVFNQEQVVSYMGFVSDGDTKQKIYEFGPALFTSARIEGTLPEAIRPSEVARNYAFFLDLTTKGDESITADPFTVLVEPPQRPGFFARIGAGLANSPAILAVIGVIILSVIGAVLITNTREKKRPIPPPRPPVLKTEIFEPASVPAELKKLGLHLKVMRTPDQSQMIDRRITVFPCVIGRDITCEVRIDGDRQVSRRHAQIIVRGNEFFITDLGSANGTFIGDIQLQPDKETRLTGRTIVRLGHHTHIALEPQK